MCCGFRKRIIYFSGFQEHQSELYDAFLNYFDCEVVHYSPLLDFDTDIKAIDELICSREVYLISSGMGCLPAMYLHFKYGFPIVLINPSYYPEITHQFELTEQNQNIYISIFKSRIRKMKKECTLNLFQNMQVETVDPEVFSDEFFAYIKYMQISNENSNRYDSIINNLDYIRICLFRDKLTPDEIEEIQNSDLSDALAPHAHYILNIIKSKALIRSFEKITEFDGDEWLDFCAV